MIPFKDVKSSKQFYVGVYFYAVIYFIAICLNLLYTDKARAADKPFWTEKSNFIEGDKVYFVGVSTHNNRLEEGRERALEAAKREVQGYLQTTSLDGLTLTTQMTYETRSEGMLDVYRLAWVSIEQVTKFRSDLLKKQKLAMEAQSKVLQTQIDGQRAAIALLRQHEADLESQKVTISQIEQNIRDLTTRAQTNLKIGMTKKEMFQVMGSPRTALQNVMCPKTNFYNYGKVWAAVQQGVLVCVRPNGRFNDSCDCSDGIVQ